MEIVWDQVGREAGDREPVFRRFHGKDERVSIKNLIFGTRLLYDLLVRFCARG